VIHRARVSSERVSVFSLPFRVQWCSFAFLQRVDVGEGERKIFRFSLYWGSGGLMREKWVVFGFKYFGI